MAWISPLLHSIDEQNWKRYPPENEKKESTIKNLIRAGVDLGR
jgi:hypothetical protein